MAELSALFEMKDIRVRIRKIIKMYPNATHSYILHRFHPLFFKIGRGMGDKKSGMQNMHSLSSFQDALFPPLSKSGGL